MSTTDLTLTPNDAAALRALVTDLQRVQSDVEPFLDLHAADAIIVNIAGRRVAGTSEIRAAMEAALASPLARVITTLDVDDIRLVHRDVALISCTKHVHDERGSDGDVALPHQGRLTYVAVRGPSGWRVASAQTTPIASA